MHAAGPRRLLTEANAELRALPGRWLASILDAAAAPRQSVDDVVRRSAGAPFAVTAILLGEPPGTRKARLPKPQLAVPLQMALWHFAHRQFCHYCLSAGSWKAAERIRTTCRLLLLQCCMAFMIVAGRRSLGVCWDDCARASPGRLGTRIAAGLRSPQHYS